MFPVSDLIDRSVALHRFHDLTEDSLDALRHFKEIASGFGTDLSGFMDALSLDRGIDHEALAGDRTALMSLHAAKGLEWPVVFITGCEEGLIPCHPFGEKDTDEERRLLYVGMTRARKRLILSHAGKRVINGRTRLMSPSPFLDLIPEALRAPLERTPFKRKRPAHKQLQLF